MDESPLAAINARPRNSNRQCVRPLMIPVRLLVERRASWRSEREPIANSRFCKSGLPIGVAAPHRRAALRSGAFEGGQHLLGEEPDVLLRERVGQGAELEEPHEHPDAELAGLGLDLADDVVGIADDRQALALAEV